MKRADLTLPDGTFVVRKSEAQDVGAIVALLADDDVHAAVESSALEHRRPYDRAFHAIERDASQLLVVAVAPDGTLAATLQLSFIPGLAHGGATRLQFDAVRVRSDLRGHGLGTALVQWGLAEGRRRGAGLAQLTSDRARDDARRFAERLGFEASHLGFTQSL